MKKKNEYGLELKVAMSLATKAAKIVREGYFKNFKHWLKEDGSPVSNLDLAANEIIIEGLKKYFPLDGIVSEESYVIGRDEDFSTKYWFVDPIDGTKSLVKRTDQFTVQIGLVDCGRPVLGVIYKPLSNEIYFGVENYGAWVKNPDGSKRPIRVNKKLNGLVGVLDSNVEEFEKSLEKLKSIGANPYIRTGGEGLRILKIAEGLANIRVSGKVSNYWDVCAPIAILTSAGGYCGYESRDDDFRIIGIDKTKDNMIYSSTKEIFDFAHDKLRKF